MNSTRMSLRLSFVRGFSLGVITLVAFTVSAFAQEPIHTEPVYRKALASSYFKCALDSDCQVVAGWCNYFAINKNWVTKYDAIPNHPDDPKGKNPRNACPPGWVPKNELKAACVARECVTR